MWNIKKNMQNREKFLFLPLHPLISDLARCLYSVAIPWHSSEELHICLYTLPESRWTMFRSRSKSMPSSSWKKTLIQIVAYFIYIFMIENKAWSNLGKPPCPKEYKLYLFLCVYVYYGICVYHFWYIVSSRIRFFWT